MWGLEEPEELWLLRKSPKHSWMGQRKFLECSTFKSPFPNLMRVLENQNSLGRRLSSVGIWVSSVTGGGSVPVRGDFLWVCGNTGNTGSTCRAPHGLLLCVVVSWESPCGQQTKRSCGFRPIPTLQRVLHDWLERVSPD